LTKKQARAQRFGNAEWGPEAIDAMYNDFVDLPVPWGGTMGDIMKDTPKDHISKVFIEDKVFKTWYHGNTVLIGDGKHETLNEKEEKRGMGAGPFISLLAQECGFKQFRKHKTDQISLCPCMHSSMNPTSLPQGMCAGCTIWCCRLSMYYKH
jgi:hypothetical protein